MRELVLTLVISLALSITGIWLINTAIKLYEHEQYIKTLVEANREMLDSISQLREQIVDIEYQIERME